MFIADMNEKHTERISIDDSQSKGHRDLQAGPIYRSYTDNML